MRWHEILPYFLLWSESSRFLDSEYETKVIAYVVTDAVSLGLYRHSI